MNAPSRPFLRRAALLAGALLLSLAAVSCRSSQTRAHLPTPLTIQPGITTRHEVLEAWGSPMAIRDEPGGRTVYVFKNDYAEGWGFALGMASPQTWILAVSDTKAYGQSAEIFFFSNDQLEKVRLRDAEGNVKILE